MCTLSSDVYRDFTIYHTVLKSQTSSIGNTAAIQHPVVHKELAEARTKMLGEQTFVVTA
jgi:hypothetical protein